MWRKNSSKRSFQFEQVDAEKIANDLDIRKKARREGRDNLPRTESESLDPTELDIIKRIERHYDSGQKECWNRLRYLERERIQAQRKLESTNFEVFPEMARQASLSLVHSSNDAINYLRDTVDEEKKNFYNFKDKYEIDEPANYPESRIFLTALVLGLLVLETIGNGWFLRIGQERGWAGGIGVALFISVINVGLSFVVGRAALPATHHRKFLYKGAGWLAGLIYLPLIVFVNLTVGHYRSLLTALLAKDAYSVSAMRQAGFDALDTSKVGNLDFQSGLLIVIGLIVALVALIDGYKFDDKYPGYGAVDRRYRRARSEYETRKSKLYEGVRKAFDKVRTDLESSIKECQDALGHWQGAVESTETAFQEFRNGVRQLETAANLLLKQYRQENKNVRNTKAPNHFSEDWRFDPDRADPDQVFEDIAGDHPSRQEKNQFIERWQKCTSEAQTSTRGALRNDQQEAFDRLVELFRGVETTVDPQQRRVLVRNFSVVENTAS